jgi:hypothetical protein
MALASGAGAMTTLVPRILAVFALAGGLLLACGGKTVGSGPSGSSSGGGSSGGGSSSSGGGGSSGSASSSGGSSGGGVACVYVDPSAYDQSCNQASDCVYIASGELCSGQCVCPQAVINASSLGAYDQATSSIVPSTCFCGNEPEPQCLDNHCTLDGSVTIDAGAPGDSGVCVDIDLTTYDQTCNADSDCIDITAGVVCSGQCACGGSTINVDGQARYEAAVAPVDTLGCPCPPDGITRCLQNHCTLCGFGPNQPPGCGDGG